MTNETRETATGQTLYRIRALRNIYGNSKMVQKGELGGFVSHHDNLSQIGNCWVADEAFVADDARIENDALIHESAKIEGKSRITDNVIIGGDAMVFESTVGGLTKITDKARLGNSTVNGDVNLEGRVYIMYSRIHGKVQVTDRVKLVETAIYGNNILLLGEANIKTTVIGSVTKETKQVVISDKVTIVNSGIYGEGIVINGDAQLISGVRIDGNLVQISDFSTLEGMIEIGSKVNMKEFARVKNMSNTIFTIDNETLSGDVLIER